MGALNQGGSPGRRWSGLGEDGRNLEASILKMVGDDYSRSIIIATISKPRSAAELSSMLDIQIATVYRKINELQRMGLLVREKSKFTGKSKLVDLYRSVVKTVSIKLDGNGVKVNYQYNLDLVKRLILVWDDLRRSKI
jgi:transposase